MNSEQKHHHRKHNVEADGCDRLFAALAIRPEVSINIPRAMLDQLSTRARYLLRFNPVVESLDAENVEPYQSFAY